LLPALFPEGFQVIRDIEIGAIPIVIVTIVSGAKPEFNECPDGSGNRNKLN
jgi:hypothetical protein